MPSEHTEMANLPRLIAQTLREEYGVDPAPVLAELGTSEAGLFEAGARLEHGKTQTLWQKALDLSGNPAIGFRVGERATLNEFGVLGFAWQASGTLLEAFELTCRYMRLVATAAVGYELESTDDTVSLVQTFPDRSLIHHRCADDAIQVAFMLAIESIAKRPVLPTRVELFFPEDGKASEYERLYGCPIVYEAGLVRLSFARVDLEQPLAGSHPTVFAALDEIAARELELLDAKTTSAMVRGQLLRLLPSGDVDQDLVAARLNRSRATLQRQLSAEGNNFREILDATRREVAQRYLRAGKHSLAEIAFLTGFSDQTSFGRAFRRWSGVSPGQFRKGGQEQVE